MHLTAHTRNGKLVLRPGYFNQIVCERIDSSSDQAISTKLSEYGHCVRKALQHEINNLQAAVRFALSQPSTIRPDWTLRARVHSWSLACAVGKPQF
mmetsp:Transcript_42670/g.67531  ORF Transcript_42670/g.67531 Transcript_42670/m.67531 type:complete len:96 (-) Transcript_42670:249-536(-)